MLHARSNRCIVRERTALKSPRPGAGHVHGQKHIFASAFDCPAPTGIAAHIDHRCEDPVEPGCRHLLRCCTGSALGKVGVETRRLSQWNRENRAIAVNDIAREDHGDAEPSLHRGSLQLAMRIHAKAVENAAQSSRLRVANKIFDILDCGSGVDLGCGGGGPGGWHQRQLPRLLFDRHLRNQRFHAARQRATYSPHRRRDARCLPCEKACGADQDRSAADGGIAEHLGQTPIKKAGVASALYELISLPSAQRGPFSQPPKRSRQRSYWDASVPTLSHHRLGRLSPTRLVSFSSEQGILIHLHASKQSRCIFSSSC